MKQAGIPETAVRFMAAFGEAIGKNELDTGRTILPALLGREPTTLKEFFRSVYFASEEVVGFS